MKKIKKPFKWMANVLKGPKTFLRAGQIGGIIACTLLAAQFIWSGILISLFDSYFVGFIVAVILVIMTNLSAFLLLRILYTCKSVARVFFMTAWLSVLAINLIATQLKTVVSSVIMTYLLAMAVNILGRCIVGFIKTRNYKNIFGYASSVVSVVIIILFSVFFHSDSLAGNVAYPSTQEDYETNELLKDFGKSLEDGNEKVVTISYGPNYQTGYCQERRP